MSQAKRDALWEAMRDAIDSAYKSGDGRTGQLRAYARDREWEDKLDTLVEREMAHERRHRHGRSVRGFTPRQAAKLLLMSNVADANDFDAFDSLTIRDTAFIASILGRLARPWLSAEWVAEAMQLDYVALMKEAK